MTSTIRAAHISDIDAIGLIAASTDLFPAEMTRPMAEPGLSGETQDLWLVAEIGQTVCAFAFLSPERMTTGTWNLLAIAVQPERQGQGIGHALVTAAIQSLQQTGQRMLLVETLGTPDFRATRRFYTKQSFVREGRIRDYYDAGGHKIIYRRML